MGKNKITAAMIEAGIDAYVRCDHEFEAYETIVKSVFLAMEEARQLPTPAVSSDRQLGSVSVPWST